MNAPATAIVPDTSGQFGAVFRRELRAYFLSPISYLVWVVFLRWRKGQPFYVGDTNHFSHRLVRRGLTRTGAVVVIWALAALIGSLVFLL